MQLRRLEVRNIRSYESGRVEFGPGTTLIVGDVGSGKTSLLYAIEMALFGVAEVDAPYLVRHGAPHAEVAVRFEDGDHRYDVSRRFRRIRRKGRESFESERITFREDGRETSYSATEVRQRVIELLGFPDNPNPQAHSDLWRWAIYVPQEKMREILSAKPQERLETIRKALGVERYRTAAENAQELSADLRGSARHRRESAERLAHHDLEFAEATEAADRLRGERVELERRIAATSVQQDAIRARVEELDRHAHQIQSDRREGESLEREQAADAAALADHGRLARERAAEVARRSAEREENRIHAERVDALRVALADADSRTRVAREELDRHGQEIRNLTTARAEVTAAERASSDSRARAERASHDREIARQEYERAAAEGPVKQPTAPVPQSVAELEARVVDARGRERGALERVAKAVSARAEIEELLAGGVCPRCHQSVRREEFEGHRTEISEEVRSAEESHRAILGEIERAEEERKSRERFERAHDRWAEVEKRREALREAQRRRESELHDTEAERAAADASREVARSRLAALEPLEQETVRRRRSLEESEAAQGRARDAAEQGSRAADR
ncbi:MAG: SMC family ATPase, partial [Thermoplasmata archaeon]